MSKQNIGLEVHFGNAPNVPRLGDPRRVPSYAYPNWGLEPGAYRKVSDDLYKSEWVGGSTRQMQYVVEAITESGLGNFSQMLRDANTQAVTNIVGHSKRHSERRLNYMEIGAGVSTVDLCKGLDTAGLDPQSLFITMVEPSESRVSKGEDSAAEKLKDMGLREGEDFRVIVGRDVDIFDPTITNGRPVGYGTQDIVSSVAAIHHHAYLGPAFTNIYRSLADQGVVLISDWHNAEWEHPARVLQALIEDYDDSLWTTKDQDLYAFTRAFPKASETPPPVPSEGDETAMMEIRRFWKQWGIKRARLITSDGFDYNNDILELEGHRPAERQVQVMNAVGLSTSRKNRNVRRLLETLEFDVNPYPLRKESRLLMVTGGVKLTC